MAAYATFIAPSAVQSTNAFDSWANGAHTQTLAFGSNVTQGNLLFAYIYGSFNPIIAGNTTGDSVSFVGFADTQGNVWTTVGGGVVSQTVSFGVGAGRNDTTVIFGMFYAFAKATGATSLQASWTAAGGDTKSIRINQVEYKNVGTFIGTNNGFATSNPATQAPLVASVNDEFYVIVEGWGYATGAPGFGGFGGALGFTGDVGSGSPSVGPVLHGIQGPSGVDLTLKMSAANAGGAPYWTGTVAFNTAPATAQTINNGFFEDYPQMTWMKNVAFLTRDYWDKGLSSPYVGQEWPVPNSGLAQSGQTYPY